MFVSVVLFVWGDFLLKVMQRQLMLSVVWLWWTNIINIIWHINNTVQAIHTEISRKNISDNRPTKMNIWKVIAKQLCMYLSHSVD